MNSRWLNTFSVIGVLLVILGIYGITRGPGFVYDPGQLSNGKEPWYYLIIGLLMVFNGLLIPAPSDETEEAAAGKSGARTAGASATSPAASTTQASRGTDAQQAITVAPNVNRVD